MINLFSTWTTPGEFFIITIPLDSRSKTQMHYTFMQFKKRSVMPRRSSKRAVCSVGKPLLLIFAFLAVSAESQQLPSVSLAQPGATQQSPPVTEPAAAAAAAPTPAGELPSCDCTLTGVSGGANTTFIGCGQWMVANGSNTFTCYVNVRTHAFLQKKIILHHFLSFFFDNTEPFCVPRSHYAHPQLNLPWRCV